MNATTAPRKLRRFSTHFKIDRSQDELEFLDIPLDTDVPLFVDPYAFKVNDGLWFVECNNLVIDFFQHVVDAIRDKRWARARELMHNLREPNSTRLGWSKGRPRGRGVGGIQAQQLLDRLTESEAVRSGKLHDLADCELMIRQISFDKISDITTNIVRKKLIEFTQQQCVAFHVPLKRVQAGAYWSKEHAFWRNSLADLPIYRGKPIILVPKLIVRYNMSVDHKEYWRQFVLDFLQQEHLNSNSSLVRVLKSGERKPPYKKSLLSEMPCDKDRLFEFSIDHPDVLKKYKDFVAGKPRQPTDETIDEMVAEVCLGRGPVTINYQCVSNAEVTMNKSTVHGDNVGGVVGGGTINARDIKSYKQIVEQSALDDETKKALVEARNAVETAGLPPGDRADVSDDIGTLTEELTKCERDANRIWSVLRRIGVIAPTVLSVLKAAKTIWLFWQGETPGN